MLRGRRGWSLFLGAAAMCGCRPDLGDRESLITGERVIAVRGEPPEARPGEVVEYDLLVASPAGTVESPPAHWAFCAAAKPLADNNSVSRECLGDAAVRPIGGPSPTVSAATPEDACAVFGPEVPPGGYRARDADSTGGYYQPVRVRLEGETAFGMERITCSLADAPVDAVQEHLARYEANRNPQIQGISASLGGAPADLGAMPAGSRVTLEVTWTAEDAEEYVLFDRERQEVTDRREAMRVSWFTTGGELVHDRTGRAEDDPDTATSNTWTAPDEPGTVHVWAVLRDSRGGVGFGGLRIEVVR